MKKKTMKLQLNRETLRNLGERDLRNAAGGATFLQCSDPCLTDGDTCDTCGSCPSFRC